MFSVLVFRIIFPIHLFFTKMVSGPKRRRGSWIQGLDGSEDAQGSACEPHDWSSRFWLFHHRTSIISRCGLFQGTTPSICGTVCALGDVPSPPHVGGELLGTVTGSSGPSVRPSPSTSARAEGGPVECFSWQLENHVIGFLTMF